MGLLGKIVGGEAVSAAEGIAKIVDRFVETPDEKRAAETLRIKLATRTSEIQAEINKIEAGHRSIFVAGARPFIMWICGGALAWHFIIHDFLVWFTSVAFPEVTVPPLVGTESLISILMALLGLAGYRTVEKLGKVAK